MLFSQLWFVRILRPSVLFGLALAFARPSPSYAAQAAQFNQGLQDGWAFDNRGNMMGSNLLLDQFGLMQQAGAGWVRMHFRLGDCFSDWETTSCRADGRTARDLYSEVVDRALAHNLQVLGLLTHESWRSGRQPEWTANNVENGGSDGNNRYIEEFANRAAYPLAAHFKDKISAWELWTKPNAWTDNSGTVYSGGTFIYPSNYAQLLKQTGAAIKLATDNRATFISGGLLGHDAGVKHQDLQGIYKHATDCPNRLSSGGDYLCAVYDMGRTRAGWARESSPFDHVGQHLYIRQNSTVTSADLAGYLDDLRSVYLTYGGEPASKETHVTAFGWTTAPFSTTTAFVSAEVQAQNLATAYGTFRDMSPSQGGYVARAYWFRTRDEARQDYSDYFGLADPAAGAKPAFFAYQEHAAF